MGCSRCDEAYPLVGGALPVLVPAPREFVARAWLHYARFAKQQVDELHKLSDAAATQLLRLPILSAFQEATRRNLVHVRALQDALHPHVAVESLSAAADEATREDDGGSYFTSLSYLQRDWAGTPEGEAEIAALRAPLFEAVLTACEDRTAALVLGAGTGRLAWELCALFDRVVATDISLGMVHQLHRVLRDDLEFFELNTRNLRVALDAVRRHVASVDGVTPAAGTGRPRGSLSYLVGDAQAVPLPASAVSAVVSVYFTDVLPLRKLLPEVKRVLRPGGCFVHVGPLEYHFLDLRDSLAVDEVRAAFEHNGFTTIHEAWVRTPHLRSSVSMSTRIFDNWLFVARLDAPTESAQPEPVGPGTVLALAGPTRFETSGILSPDGDDSERTTLVVASGAQFDGAGTVLDILRAIDGRRTAGELIEELGQDYNIPDAAARNAILGTLTLLVERGGLRVVH